MVKKAFVPQANGFCIALERCTLSWYFVLAIKNLELQYPIFGRWCEIYYFVRDTIVRNLKSMMRARTSVVFIDTMVRRLNVF